jgi:hypothetical protein
MAADAAVANPRICARIHNVGSSLYRARAVAPEGRPGQRFKLALSRRGRRARNIGSGPAGRVVAALPAPSLARSNELNSQYQAWLALSGADRKTG